MKSESQIGNRKSQILISCLDEEFARLHERSLAIIKVIPAEKLYWQPRPSSGAFPIYSCGEHLLRSAAAVEQTFGGINANLWDDPFEWTLPETLQTPDSIVEYLMEVEATRGEGFERFSTDDDLVKEIAVPSGETRRLGALLFETLTRAAHHQGRAFAVFRLFSDSRLPQV
ncbi:MAG TPA: hypothetical protein VGC66_18605 [Pyrinomonadaceae bacterium]